MPLAASGFIPQELIDSAIHLVEQQFAPDVVRIGHSIGENHYGGPAIFFRVLLRDEAAPLPRLTDLARRVPIALMNEAETFEHGLRAYSEFRTVSEQQSLNHPNWN